MSFKIDYNNVGSAPVKPGEYEVYPTEFDARKAQSGNDCVIMNYTIRDDVDQPSQGSEIRYDNFTFTQNSLWRFNQAAKAAGIPEGTDFASPEEWAKAMINRPLRIVVGERTYNGNTYPTVKMFKNSLVSQAGPVNQKASSGFEDPFANNSKPIDISDDDLPF
jgi:hypothetical protein